MKFDTNGTIRQRLFLDFPEVSLLFRHSNLIPFKELINLKHYFLTFLVTLKYS